MNRKIFLESETFRELGGWTVDTQSYEALGSFYLLAHGIGKPVRDAVTEFRTEERMLWHVLACSCADTGLDGGLEAGNSGRQISSPD